MFDLSSLDMRIGDDLVCQKFDDHYLFFIKSIFIEDVVNQAQLISGDVQPGEFIKIDTYFGWYDGADWIDIPLRGRFKVHEIEVVEGIFEIRLGVQIPLHIPIEKTMILVK